MNKELKVIICFLVMLGSIAPAFAVVPLIDLEAGTSLVTNMKAHKVGDIITVLITESTTANASSKVDANNKSEVSGGPGLGILDVVTDWGLNLENKYSGDGRTQRSGNLQAEITVRIVEQLHNGDFRINGNRMVEINGERQLIEISGICRARDIMPDNTIYSTYIADARIAYNGTGVVNSTSEPGVVTKLVNWLF
ncbi:MAG: flagellar basal body L-ring protein FlgH [bacterium]|nr:flagellar basal body L-ring protein FlgH [bacterium]MCP4800712.1 flagellar basal body L-ring protein FlgH [bacterium]